SADLAGIEDIHDREAYHVTGTATSEIIAPLTAGTMTGDEVDVELWIDVETSDLLRVKVIEPESEAKENPATWEMNLSAFNEMVTIEPPE
ncbi:MAG: LppX_LprAFG lipoprotein, partial [Thermomicrobiales bacterium]